MLTAITGINWGDEGKGRMVDLISQEYDIVARYQGGNNAGHTVKNERGKFVLNLLPSGILRPNVVCVMGNGMVIDPHHLDGEINKLREQGIEITPKNLKISDRATITMPYHVDQDGLEEARLAKTGAQFGSTKRGIAYAYGDKYMKKTLRMGDLLHLDDAVKKRLVTMVDSKNLVMVGSYNADPISVDEMWAWLEKYAAIFKDYICDVGQYLADARMTHEMLKYLREAGKPFVPYFDVPVQHSHPDVLSRMGRPFARNPREAIDRIRNVFPEAALRTSIMVGFPGETEEHFEHLREFIEEVRFQHLGVFAYRAEEGTPAAAMPDQVEDRVKEWRRDLLMEAQADISAEWLSRFEGDRLSILVDAPHPEWPGLHTGRAWFQAPEIDGMVYISGPGVEPGALVDADIVECRDYDLVALA